MPSVRYTLSQVLINLLLSSPTLANPLPAAPAPSPEQSIYNVGGEAVYTPTSGGAAAAITAVPFHIEGGLIASPPNVLSITVINKHTAPISTYHAHEAGGPTAIGGEAGSGTMAKGATAAFAVPTGWAGNVAVVEYGGGRTVAGDESLIEANFKKPDGYTVAVADVDISYV